MLSISEIGSLSKIYNYVPQTLLGDILCLLRFLLHHPDSCRVMYCYSTFLFHYYYSYSYYYSSTHFFCPLNFSEIPRSNFMKPCRNTICHVKLCCEGLIFSKWLPLPWKRPKCQIIEKHKNDHSRLLAEHLMNEIIQKNRNRLGNLAAVAIETKKGGLNFFFDSFHQTSLNFVRISTVGG